MKKKKNDFFSSYGENSSKIDHILITKMAITQKIKTVRFRTFRIFHVHMNTFEKKIEFYFFILYVEEKKW